MRNPRLVGLFLFIIGMPWVSRAATSSEDYRQAGLALYRAGQYSKAVSYFQQAVQVDPNNSVAFEDLGDAYLKLNDQTDALTAFQQSLQLHPNNPTLQTLVDSLSGSDSGEDSAASDSSGNADQQVAAPIPAATPYADGMPAMNHAKFWAKAEAGYDYWGVPTFVDSANTFNNGQFNPGNAISGSVSYTGSASAANNNLEFGGELGFLLNPNIGIAIGARLITGDGYSANIDYDTGDSEQLTLNESLIPLTVDLYLFLPDPLGRFFISGGVGYYLAQIEVDQTTTSNNFFGTDNGNNGGGSNEWTGLFNSGNIGFDVSAGHDFAIADTIGLEVFARAFFVQITNFQGQLTDSNGNTQNYGLAQSASGPTIVDADVQGNIGGSEQYATLDFTGFNFGLTFLYY